MVPTGGEPPIPDATARPGDADLEYDLAHDVPLRVDLAPDAVDQVLVATQTDDVGGDYGYDLAHDVPRQ